MLIEPHYGASSDAPSAGGVHISLYPESRFQRGLNGTNPLKWQGLIESYLFRGRKIRPLTVSHQIGTKAEIGYVYARPYLSRIVTRLKIAAG